MMFSYLTTAHIVQSLYECTSILILFCGAKIKKVIVLCIQSIVLAPSVNQSTLRNNNTLGDYCWLIHVTLAHSRNKEPRSTISQGLFSSFSSLEDILTLRWWRTGFFLNKLLGMEEPEWQIGICWSGVYIKIIQNRKIGAVLVRNRPLQEKHRCK